MKQAIEQQDLDRYFAKLEGRKVEDILRNKRPSKGKKTRLFLDNEYIEEGYIKVLPPSTTKVLMVLARHANQKTQVCYPSIKTIQEKAGISRSSAQQAVVILEGCHIISVLRRGGGNRPNEYLLQSSSVWQLPSREQLARLRKVKISRVKVSLLKK